MFKIRKLFKRKVLTKLIWYIIAATVISGIVLLPILQIVNAE